MKRIRLWIVSVAFATAMGLATAGAQDQAGTARATAPTGSAPEQSQVSRFRQFSGTPIDVDYQAANLRDSAAAARRKSAASTS